MSTPNRIHVRPLAPCIAAIAAACVVGGALGATFALNPTATYLKTNNDNVPGATPIALASLGIVGGDRIELTRLGDFDNGPQGDTFTSMFGVFSSNDILLPSNELNRVPGALEAGVDVVSSTTFMGGLPTDIPQDFVISTAAYPSGSICIVVPPRATHLFLTTGDHYFVDNSDPDADWGIEITLLDACAADLDANGGVTAGDLAILLGGWGASSAIGAPGDLDCDGDVDAADLAVLLGSWGSCGG